MRLIGKIYAGEHLLKSAQADVIIKKDIPFNKSLDMALINICHSLNLPNIFWLSKNSKEFSKYQQTIFSSEQFSDPVNFTQFHIKLIED